MVSEFTSMLNISSRRFFFSLQTLTIKTRGSLLPRHCQWTPTSDPSPHQWARNRDTQRHSLTRFSKGGAHRWLENEREQRWVSGDEMIAIIAIASSLV